MVKYAFMGFGITFVCLFTIVIPIVHFVSVPMAPLIGGWFAGNSAKAEPGTAVGIGVLMGILMLVPAILAVVVAAIVVDVEDWVLRVLGIGIPLLTVFLGSIGAMIGGAMSRS